ncbi:MAG: hypothetical protein ACRCR9_04145, partial [Chitinophagaceae bacterium]
MAGRSSFEMLDVACNLLAVPQLPKDLQLKFITQADTEVYDAILNESIPLKEGLQEFLSFLEANNIAKA